MARPAGYSGHVGFPARTAGGEAVQLELKGEHDRDTGLAVYREYGGERRFVLTGHQGIVVELDLVLAKAGQVYASAYELAHNWPVGQAL